MGLARGSPFDLGRARRLTHPRLSAMLRLVPAPGLAPAPRLRPTGHLSKSNARGSPGIPVPTSAQDRQADHLPHPRHARDYPARCGTMYLLKASDEIRTVQELPSYQIPADVRHLYALGPVMLVLQLALSRGDGFPQAGRDLRLRIVNPQFCLAPETPPGHS